MIEFPYGIADFYAIRRDGMLYVDRTAYVREVERLGRVLVFLRPRRFGKSLWLQTLANYYDLRRQDQFEELFSELDGGLHPSALRNRYFVLQWNFSAIDPSGGIERIARSLREHVTSRAEVFVSDYEGHLPGTVRTDASPAVVMDSLLSAIRKTPYKLYLLIDEYDNFLNEVMVEDASTYHALVDTDGPFKLLFKSVKNATEGLGLERVFVTGVSPIALNDLTSGFNNARDLTLEPELAALCGFRESEIRDVLGLIARERDLSPEEIESLMERMRTWYNGYRFSKDADELVYNPTNALYFLENVYRRGTPPDELYDQNLRTDRGKLAFLARTAAGAGVIEKLTEGDDGTIAISRLETSFSLANLTTRMTKDRNAVASFLYYMGLLTLAEVPLRLRIPNLVVRKLFLDRLLEIFLPEAEDGSQARELARIVFQEGDIRPLLSFFEDKLLPVLSNRDQGAAPGKGRGGSGVNEMVVKSLFLAILFDDHHYRISSEPELERSYADLCLLVRDEMRPYSFFDLLFEFKLVRRKDLGRRGREIRDLSDEALLRLPPVAKALVEARQQIETYRSSLFKQHGASSLNLKSYAVVAVGLERVVGEEIAPT
jgi:hypothetical protein